MVHIDFLKNCSDKDIVQMIDEYNNLRQSGVLIPTGLFRQLTETVSRDYNSTYNLRFGEEALMSEVYNRFKIRFEQSPKMKDLVSSDELIKKYENRLNDKSIVYSEIKVESTIHWVLEEVINDLKKLIS